MDMEQIGEWVSERGSLQKFKQILIEKRHDPDYADSKVLPFCNTGWKLGDVRKYIDYYIKTFPEYTRKIEGMTMDRLAQQCKAQMQGEQNMMMGSGDSGLMMTDSEEF